jgi:hypothetical protein
MLRIAALPPAPRASSLLGALLLAATAACSDSPAAPAGADRPAARDAASLAKGENAQRGIATQTVVTLALMNTRGSMVPNTTVEFTVEAAFKPTVKLVTDNDAADADKRDGYFSVQMPVTGGKYRALMKSAPAEYAPVTFTPWIPSGGTTTSLGIYTVYRRPLVTLRLESTFGGLVGLGSAFYVPSGPTLEDPWRTVHDNGAGDLSPEPGIVSFRVTSHGIGYVPCETKAPNNFALANPACFATGLPVESSVTHTLQHAPLFK